MLWEPAGAQGWDGDVARGTGGRTGPIPGIVAISDPAKLWENSSSDARMGKKIPTPKAFLVTSTAGMLSHARTALCCLTMQGWVSWGPWCHPPPMTNSAGHVGHPEQGDLPSQGGTRRTNPSKHTQPL